MSGSFALPTTTDEQVAQFQAEFQAAFNGRSQDAMESAKCRLIWALVHSTTRSHVQRGVDLARTALERDQRTGDQDRELRYFLAVGLYSLGQHVASRNAVNQLLADYPEFRQADALKEEVDTRVIQEGLVGVGVLGAVVAGVVGIAVAVARGSSRR